MVVFHVGAMAALFFFSWKALVLAVLLWWVAGGLGIGMGYHRLLTHRGYKTPKWMEYVLAVCGTLALEGDPCSGLRPTACITRTPIRRATRILPTMAVFGLTWAGFLPARPCKNSAELMPYVPDLRKDRFHMWISRWHWVPITVLAVCYLPSADGDACCGESFFVP